MHFIKKLIPNWLLKFIRPYYHGTMALLAHMYFGRPSDKLIVIGVTGTNGKTTTVNLIAKILEEEGYRVGFMSTAVINITGIETLNKMKMTMPSGWILHKTLRHLVDRQCQYAVLEVSSEGLAQNRHWGINFDTAVLTNLTPEHLESHGGFENYKRAKGLLFEAINNSQKTIFKKQINSDIKKSIVVNADDLHAQYFLNFKAEQHITYGEEKSADFQASKISYSPAGVNFSLGSVDFRLQLKGQFDVYNALAAIAAVSTQGVDIKACKRALEKIEVVPGRVEVLLTKPFTVVVDYAYEPVEMDGLYETVSRWPHGRIIQVLGPTGGGRDSARIPILGKMAGKFVDIMIITTDDPYDDNPKQLAERMAEGAMAAGKIENKTLFTILNRRAAIAKAINGARDGDLVLITGKGADQKMAIGDGHYIEWDDRKVVREELGFKTINAGKSVEKNWFA
jgi:UDP-N-acetylmuramoyl-L-alanyl-D-glutamate--2,6-diaminopimelate ligase